jgi:hypothetical protein
MVGNVSVVEVRTVLVEVWFVVVVWVVVENAVDVWLSVMDV